VKHPQIREIQKEIRSLEVAWDMNSSTMIRLIWLVIIKDQRAVEPEWVVMAANHITQPHILEIQGVTTTEIQETEIEEVNIDTRMIGGIHKNDIQEITENKIIGKDYILVGSIESYIHESPFLMAWTIRSIKQAFQLPQLLFSRCSS
jgi:hypothetical protein